QSRSQAEWTIALGIDGQCITRRPSHEAGNTGAPQAQTAIKGDRLGGPRKNTLQIRAAGAWQTDAELLDFELLVRPQQAQAYRADRVVAKVGLIDGERSLRLAMARHEVAQARSELGNTFDWSCLFRRGSDAIEIEPARGECKVELEL